MTQTALSKMFERLPMRVLPLAFLGKFPAALAQALKRRDPWRWNRPLVVLRLKVRRAVAESAPQSSAAIGSGAQTVRKQC